MSRNRQPTGMKRMDLSKPNCHICGRRLRRDLIREKEWCTNPSCQIRNFEFNISYVDVDSGIQNVAEN